ncbi:MAG: hypothetical protein K2Y32_24060 [Candidatus Obscuribacterales bacterium]|nr:hypothetical protein [Candidatus Obscuribacterales bacterium]
MDLIKSVNVFYSSKDERTFASITGVLRQLELLAATWITSKGDEIELKLHDTDAVEGFELSHEMVEQIISQNETVLTLVAPNVLLGRGMLTSEAWQKLLAANKEKRILLKGIYCEKVCNRDRLLTLLGGWLQSKMGLHLSSGNAVNDEAADLVDRLTTALEKYFYD